MFSPFYPRALGLLLALADSALTVGSRKTFWRVRQVFFFTKMAITRERKGEKLSPTWEMNRLSEGRWPKLVLYGKKLDFWAKNRDFAPQKYSLFDFNHVLATTGKSCWKKKVAFAQINITQNDKSPLDYLGKGTFFRWTTFSGRGQNMVSPKKWMFFGPKISVFGPKIRFLPYDPNFGQWPKK